MSHCPHPLLLRADRLHIMPALPADLSAMSKPFSSTATQVLQELTAASRPNRVNWLLEGLLEVQALITEPDFDLDNFMQRIVELAENFTNATSAVVELVEGEEMVYRCTSSAISEHLGLRIRRN